MQTNVEQNISAINEIEIAVEQLRKAMVDADGNKLSELTSDELSYGHSSGKIENKEQFVSCIASGESNFVTIELTGQTIKVVNDTAIVRHTLVATTNDEDKGPGAVKIGILLVWIKNGDRWLLLARQAVKII